MALLSEMLLICFLFRFLQLDGQTLPINRRQRAYNNGTLIIEQLQRLEDAGTYTCMAQNKQKQTSRRNVEIQVLGKCFFCSSLQLNITSCFLFFITINLCHSLQFIRKLLYQILLRTKWKVFKNSAVTERKKVLLLFSFVLNFVGRLLL